MGAIELRQALWNPRSTGPQIVIVFLNFFVGAFLGDAFLTILDGFGRMLGLDWFSAPREMLAVVVFWASPIVLFVSLSSLHLPKRVLLPLVFGIWWLNLGALPLGVLLAESRFMDLVLGLLQIGFALPTLVWIRQRSGGAAWGFEETMMLARPYDRRRFMLALAVVFVGGPVVAGLLGLTGALVWMRKASGGFVGFGASGLTLAERHYQRDDREIRLIGMSHVGKKGIYDALLQQSDGTSTVILEEGLTDTQGLLRGSAWQGPLALALGLDSQPRAAEMIGDPASTAPQNETLEIESGDVDISDFRPSTLEFVRLSLRLSASPGDADASEALNELIESRGMPELYAQVVEDVLRKRNRHLLGRIDESLEKYQRVVVPWGVMHLPEIEAALLDRGFVLKSTAQRPFLPYDAVAQEAVRMLAPVSASNPEPTQ